MPVFSVVYLFAVVCVAYLAVLPGLLTSALILLFGLFTTLLGLFLKRTQLARIYSKIVLLLAVFCIGFSLAALHGRYLLGQQFSDSAARLCTANGVVVGLPQVGESYSRFIFKVTEGDCNGEVLASRKISLSLYDSDYQVNASDRLRLELKLRSFRGNYSVDSFDAKLWALNNGIHARGYVRKIITVEKGNSLLFGLRHKVRHWITAQDISTQAKASLAALMLGDKSAISSDQWQHMRSTGTLHLLVVSGLHIGIMVAIGWWLFVGLRSVLLMLGWRYSLVFLPELGALSLSFSYLLLAGASLSTQRAWLMAFVLLAGQWLSVRSNLWQRWWLALLIIISWQPLSVVQPGLWLSFAAVASLIALQGFRTSKSKYSVLIKSQCWVWLGLTPLLLLYFQQISLIAPLINLFAISFISLLLMLLIPALLLALINYDQMLKLLAATLDYYWQLLAGLDTYSQYFLVGISGVDGFWLLLLALGCLCVILPISRWLKCIALSVWLVALYPPKDAPLQKYQFKLTLIDVGQGLAVLVQTRGRNLLFDTGAAFPSGFSYYSAVVKPQLVDSGVDKLDLLVVSHADNDHSGGVSLLQQDYSPGAIHRGMVVTSEQISDACRSDDRWVWDGVSFHYRQPVTAASYKRNNQSCVLELGNAQCKIIIMGDAEKKIETLLLASVINARQRLLVVGHHGSNTSTSEEFLRRENFSSALISNGFNNRYGHPHSKVLSRLKSAAVSVHRTDLLGTITVSSTASGCSISSYKQQYKRYWW